MARVEVTLFYNARHALNYASVDVPDHVLEQIDELTDMEEGKKAELLQPYLEDEPFKEDTFDPDDLDWNVEVTYLEPPAHLMEEEA